LDEEKQSRIDEDGDREKGSHKLLSWSLEESWGQWEGAGKVASKESAVKTDQNVEPQGVQDGLILEKASQFSTFFTLRVDIRIGTRNNIPRCQELVTKNIESQIGNLNSQ